MKVQLAVVNRNCRNGWKRYMGSCYRFVKGPYKNWNNAELSCTTKKSHLVQIDNQKEYNFIKHEINILHKNHTGSWGYNDCYWTDGNDFDAEGVWMWATSQTRIGMTHWARGEPSSINSTTIDEDCINLTLGNHLKWNDDHCDKPCSFVCEIEDGSSVLIG